MLIAALIVCIIIILLLMPVGWVIDLFYILVGLGVVAFALFASFAAIITIGTFLF